VKRRRHLGSSELLCAILLMLGIACNAHADSDLYWCSADNYLAYDVRGIYGPAVHGHELRLVRFGVKDQSPSVAVVPIPDGQVHRLNCSPESIVVIQYEAAPIKGLMEHRILLKDAQPQGVSSKPLAVTLAQLPGGDPHHFWTRGLSSGASVDEVNLTPSGYKLIIRRYGKDKCQANVKVLLRHTSAPRFQDFPICKFRFPLECGE